VWQPLQLAFPLAELNAFEERSAWALASQTSSFCVWQRPQTRESKLLRIPAVSPACSLPGPWQLSHWVFDSAAVWGVFRTVSSQVAPGSAKP